jgi:hypothetical protein
MATFKIVKTKQQQEGKFVYRVVDRVTGEIYSEAGSRWKAEEDLEEAESVHGDCVDWMEKFE